MNTPNTKQTLASILALGLILMLVVIVLAACGPAATATVTQAPAQAESGSWQEISIQQAAQKRDAGVLMLDVREQDEWNTLHIPGATLIPLGQLEGRLNELPKDQEVVVYCRSGNRSKSGAEILAKAGFANVSSMAGGMNQWQSAGYPTESGQ